MADDQAARRTAAVTGAGSGLGRSIALKLADKGYRVYGTGLADAEATIFEMLPVDESRCL